MAAGDYSTGWGIYEGDDGSFVAIDNDITGDMMGPERQSHFWGGEDLGPLYQTEPQSPAAPVIPGWLPLAAYGTGLALGNSGRQGGIADALTPNVNSVPMEGPMRFAGRGIPHPDKGYHKDYPGLAGPDYPIEDGPDVMIPMPMPKFPIHPGPDPIWAVPPYSPPAQPDRHPPDSTMIVPEVVYPPEDTKSEWEKWRESFIDDWRAR